MNTLSTKIIYFVYARKSSESEDRQEQSIDDQIKELKRMAAVKGLSIKEVLVESHSAKKPGNRPVFLELLKRIEAGEANGILCWHLNRLSRNPIDSGTLSWMLQQNIIKCIKTMERDYLPDDNVILFSVESGMANQYIIDLRKSSRRGMIGKAERGWLPSRAPLGYLNDKIENTIVKDAQRFSLVRKMWDMMLTGLYNPSKILRIVNIEWGMKTPQWKHSGNKMLSTSLIYKMFNNIFYTGNFEWNGQLYVGNHEAMITYEEFDRVQCLLGKKGKPRAKKHEAAYTGMITCAHCGARITMSIKDKFIKKIAQNKSFTYYHCTHKKKYVKCDESLPIRLEELESQIDLEIERFTIIPEFYQWALDILESDTKDKNQDAKEILSMLQNRLFALKKELDNLAGMCSRELIDEDTFIRNKAMIKEKMIRLESQLAQPENKEEKTVDLTRDTFNLATYGRNKYLNGSVLDKKLLLNSLGQNFLLKDKKLIFDKHIWLISIENAYPKLKAEFDRIELDKTLTPQGRSEEMNTLFIRWGAVVKDVRTQILQYGASSN